MGLFKSIVKNFGSSLGGVAGGIIGGPAGAALGSSLGGALSGFAEDEMNKDSANLAYNRQLAMWNMNNAYNNPIEQMKRLKAAGLNPNLVYGSGNVTGNSSSATSGNFGYNVVSSKANFINDMFTSQRMVANDVSIDNTLSEMRAREIAMLGSDIDNQIKAHNLEVARKTGQPVGDNSTISQWRRIGEDMFGDFRPEFRDAMNWLREKSLSVLNLFR